MPAYDDFEGGGGGGGGGYPVPRTFLYTSYTETAPQFSVGASVNATEQAPADLTPNGVTGFWPDTIRVDHYSDGSTTSSVLPPPPVLGFSFSVMSGGASDQLILAPTGGAGLTVSGQQIYQYGSVIGAWSGGFGASALNVTLGGGVLPAVAAAVMDAIRYVNTSDAPPSAVTVLFSAQTLAYDPAHQPPTSYQPIQVQIAGVNDAPVVSGPVVAQVSEGGAVSTLNALATASDLDAGATLHVVNLPAGLPAGVTFNAATQAFSFDPSNAAYQHLGPSTAEFVQVNYGVSDGTATVSAEALWAVMGTNDAPVVSGAVTGLATEDGPVRTLNALANASDVDDATTLSVVNVPANLPAGVTYDAANHAFTLDPANAAYQNLAAGETRVVRVNYGVSDGMATTAASTSWTVTGANDAPVISATVTGTLNADGSISTTLNALATASDVDAGATLHVVNVPANLPAGVTYNAATHAFSFDPSNAAYQYLARGTAEFVQVNYGVSDGTATVSADALWVVMGTNDAPVVSGAVTGLATEDGPVRTLNALANASDAGGVTTLSVVDVPANLPAGVTYDAANHAFTLNPANAAYQNLAAGETRVVTVNYGVTDGGATTAASTSWTVTGANDAPVISAPVGASVNEGGAVSTLNALANASDVDAGSSLHVVNVPANLPAGVTYNPATGAFSLDPVNAAYQHLAAGQTTTVSVSYGVSDGMATTAASASWTVTGTNDAPVAVADTAAGTENQALTIDVLANDTDADDGASRTLVSVTAPAGKGLATVVGGKVAFDPGAAFDHLAAGATETVTLNYAMKDDQGAASASTVTVTITGTNDAPVAVADTAAGTENQALTIDVLANDTDADDGAGRTLVSVSAPAGKGLATVVGGKVAFDPGAAFDHLAAGATETVTLNYAMKDDQGAISASTVTVTITGTNDAPVVAGAVTGAATEDGAASTLDARALASDVDTGAVLGVVDVPGGLPAGVTYDVTAQAFSLDAGAAAYQHLAAGETTTVSVSYGVSDGTVATPASVSWTVTGTNDAPVVSGAVTGAATEDAAASTLNALANASDVDTGAVLSVVNVAALPAGVSYDAGAASFTLNPGAAAYQHLAAGETATVSVSYGVSDGTVTTPASVSWTVTGTNDAPVVSGAVTGAASEDGAASTLDARAHASDVDTGAVLSVVGVPAGLPAGVTYDAAAQAFTLNAGASAYQHLGLGQTALVSVAYGVSDGTVTTSASVSWTVTGTNDGPIAVNDTGAVNEDASVTLNVLANDTDVDDGDSKTITAVGATALGGHVTLVGGQLVYAADADLFDHLTLGQSLTDSFTYTMKDAAGLTSTATATVTVRGVADGADLIGGNKTQVLTGTTLDEYIAGGNADDTLYGADGADKLHGNNGKDLLYGGQGQDLLFGENGSDLLDGGIGNDTLSGGNGPDTFVFGANFGADVVTDFDNSDTLRFVGGYTTAAQVLSHASQRGADVLIVSGADSILLKGVALSSLSAGDFLFG